MSDRHLYRCMELGFALVLFFLNCSHCFGQGDSIFTPKIFASGHEPGVLAHGDLDGDGDEDVVAANWYRMTVLLNDGRGNFTQSTQYTTYIDRTSDIEILDINADSHLDVVVADAHASHWVIFYNLGNGVLSDLDLGFPHVSGGADTEFADVNNDNLNDILVTSWGVSVMFGKLDGTFEEPIEVISSGVMQMVIADFDNDQTIDIVGGDSQNLDDPHRYSIYIGSADGTFIQTEQFDFPASTAIAADINTDSNQDLVLVGDQHVRLYLGMGDGTFELVNEFEVSCPDSTECFNRDAVVDDFDSDGNLDLAITSHDGYWWEASWGRVNLFFGDGTGSFPRSKAMLTSRAARHLIAADFDGDNFSDLAVANPRDDLLAIHQQLEQTSFYLGNDFLAPDLGKVPFATGDFDADGKTDLAITVYEQGAPLGRIMLNSGDCSFDVHDDFSIGDTYRVVAANIDGNSATDLMYYSASGGLIRIYLNKGDGTFDFRNEISLNAFRPDLLTVDLETDGDDDFVLASGNDVLVLKNAGGGDFQMTTGASFSDQVTTVQLANSNQDQSPDLFVGHGNSVSSLLGTVDGKFVMVDQLQHTLPSSLKIFSAETNGDGISDVVGFDHNVLSVWQGDGTGSFGLTQITVIDDSDDLNLFMVADFNQDGIDDFIFDSLGSFSSLLGDATGMYGKPIHYAAPQIPFFVGVADMDQDTDLDLVIGGGTEGELAIMVNSHSQQLRLGDVNLDSEVNLLDVGPFVELIVNGQYLAEGDINQDGSVDTLDINPLIDLLSG